MPDWLHSHHPWYVILLRLGVALACGAVVGFDREQRGHAAGLRTHMLVAMGAATFALIALEAVEYLARKYPGTDAPQYMLHVVAAVVGGIGFLGAGAIIESRGKVVGLTTAAGMWTVAAIGVAAGLGFHVLALISTALAFLTLAAVAKIESRIPRDRNGSAPPKSNSSGS